MRASTKRILSILLSGLFLIALIVVASTFIKPEFDKATQKRALLFSKQNLFQNQQNAVNQVQSLIDQFQGFDQLQNTIDLAMPTSEENTLILDQVTAIAENSGVEIRSFESFSNVFEESDQPLAKRLGSSEIEISVAGSYGEVSNFVNLLETNVRIFNIKGVDLSSVINEAGNSIIESSITFNAYFQEQ